MPAKGTPLAPANERQVDGDHYRTCLIQPWDFVERNGLGFLEGCALKYVTRAGRKPGVSAVQDIDKAIHFLEKLQEEHVLHGRRNRRYSNTPSEDPIEYSLLNKLPLQLASVVRTLLTWERTADLEHAIRVLREYLVLLE